MIEYVFRPIDTWPREFTKERQRRSPFHSEKTVHSATTGERQKIKAEISFDRIVRDLASEVEKHGGERLIIQLALQPDSFRRDGLPYASSLPAHPGVIVSFDGTHGPVKMPCDAFEDWKTNLRAISVTLGHLRGVDRYGVSQHGEQYRGWTALPAGPQEMSGAEAAAFIASHVEFIPASWLTERKDAFETAYRIVAKKLHPDSGGNEEEFKKLQTAAEVLRRHHGVSE